MKKERKAELRAFLKQARANADQMRELAEKRRADRLERERRESQA